MGRQNRQKRRVNERRQQRRHTQPAARSGGGPGIWVVGAIAAAIVIFGALVLANRGPTQGATATPVPTLPPPSPAQSLSTKSIDGIPCTTEMLSYHVHAHLTILDAGRSVAIPAGVGIRDNQCLYWLHTHDASGLIHVEAPHPIRPVLGEFFDVWGQPLSRSRVADVSVRPGRGMKVYVNAKPYSGNPRGIVLRSHTTITIEVGPPFPAPQSYGFNGP